MTGLIIGLFVASVSMSLAACLMARMRRKALERVVHTWEATPEGGDD